MSAVRVTKPGGIVFVAFTNWLSPYGGHETSPWHYLGGERAVARYQRSHGAMPKNHFRYSLHPVSVAEALEWTRSAPGAVVVDAVPRYLPGWTRPLLRAAGVSCVCAPSADSAGAAGISAVGASTGVCEVSDASAGASAVAASDAGAAGGGASGGGGWAAFGVAVSAAGEGGGFVFVQRELQDPAADIGRHEDREHDETRPKPGQHKPDDTTHRSSCKRLAAKSAGGRRKLLRRSMADSTPNCPAVLAHIGNEFPLFRRRFLSRYYKMIRAAASRPTMTRQMTWGIVLARAVTARPESAASTRCSPTALQADATSNRTARARGCSSSSQQRAKIEGLCAPR